MLPRNCYSSKRLRASLIVLHHISDNTKTIEDGKYSIENVEKILKQYKLSYHYWISRTGIIHQLVPLKYRAYHAGYSRYNKKDWCNSFSFGIALAGDNVDDYTDAQYQSLSKLIVSLSNRVGIKLDLTDHKTVRDNFIKSYGHLDKYKEVKKKYDLNDKFDWVKLKTYIKIEEGLVCLIS